MDENNYFTEMCSGSEAGSYLRLIHFVYHSTLGLIIIKKKDQGRLAWGREVEEGFVAKRDPLKIFSGLLPESQGQNLALTVYYVPYSLESGTHPGARGGGGFRSALRGTYKTGDARLWP